MEELTIRLNNLYDTYDGFVGAVIGYVKKKQSRFDKITNYMDENPQAGTSEILEYISDQDDFYEDVAYSEDQMEAEKILDNISEITASNRNSLLLYIQRNENGLEVIKQLINENPNITAEKI